jgi:putative flippase GtrA
MLKLNEKHFQKMKFAAVGVWNGVFGYGIFFLLDKLLSSNLQDRTVAYMTALVLSQIVSVINAYVGHRYFTFKSQAKGRAMIFEFLRFQSTYIGTFLLSFVLLPAFVELGGIPPKISAAIVMIITAIVSYFLHAKISFKSRRKLHI